MDSRKVVMRLDFPIRSLNQLLRQHWATRRKHLEDWEWAIKAAFNGLPPRAKGRMRVRITSYRTKFLDKDNLIGGAKPLVDALRNQGLIKDDSPQHVEIEYHQIKVRGDHAKTVVELEAA